MKGYYLTVGNKGYFYKSDAAKRTAAVVNAFIDILAARRNLDPETVAKIKKDKATTDKIRHDITPAQIIKKDLETMSYYSITGPNFTANYPEADFNNEIILF